MIALVAERSLRIRRRDLGLVALAALVSLAEPDLVRLRAREDERLDDRADPRRDADLRGADRARARARASVAEVLDRGARSRSPASGFVALGSSGGVSGDLRGDLLGIATAATWAAYSVAVAPLMQRVLASRISAVVLSLGWVLIALVGFPQVGGPGLRPRLEGLGCCSRSRRSGRSWSRTLLWFRRLHRIGASRATLVANLQPFVAAVFALVLLSERMTLLQVVGGDPDRRRDPDRAAPPARACRPSKIRPVADTISCRSTGWDHLELWVGNAKQAAYWYEHALGFTRVAYAGPETGVRDRASYVLEQGEIRLVLTSGAPRRQRDRPLRGARTATAAKDVALQVPDAAAGVPRGRRARRARRRRAALGRGRARPRRARDDRDLRRERPHVRHPLRLRGPVSARLRLAGAERRTGATASA